MKVSIIGTVGLPAAYGGFETLVDNLVHFNEREGMPLSLEVYCSGVGRSGADYHGARLRYINLPANGIASVVYDVLSMWRAFRGGADCILVLGVSGAIFLPILRQISGTRVVTNIDGLEWRRDKWSWYAKQFLKISERLAVRYSDVVISDNEAIAEHVKACYGKDSAVIAYGGDQWPNSAARDMARFSRAGSYALSICRIEPENNVDIILSAFRDGPVDGLTLRVVGNWNASQYGKELRSRYGGKHWIELEDPIYDPSILDPIRRGASCYLHGHSAGGTNPSLVEAMHYALPVVAFDCTYNRYTTEGRAGYFQTADELRDLLAPNCRDRWAACGVAMLEIATRRYTWRVIGRQYVDLLLQPSSCPSRRPA